MLDDNKKVLNVAIETLCRSLQRMKDFRIRFIKFDKILKVSEVFCVLRFNI